MDMCLISQEQPVLIAGPTASGKSSLALKIAQSQGGIIINADALQVFDGLSLLTARPNAEELTLAPHYLYGHVPFTGSYTTGDWLRDVSAILQKQARPIIVGGTGLYFRALTEGLAAIPPIDAETHERAARHVREDTWRSLIASLAPETAARIDLQNPMRVTRAWEVQQSTGRPIHVWQDETPAPLLALEDSYPIVLDAPKDWLSPRIEKRFDLMLEQGALNEVRSILPLWNPSLGAAKAIGAPELVAHLQGNLPIKEARDRAITASIQYAKRQRTWFRKRMQTWFQFVASNL